MGWRGFLCACLAAVLSACVAADPLVTTVTTRPSGLWRIEQQIDRITGAPNSSAVLTTRRASHSGMPFARPAVLQIGCFNKQPIVRLAFEFKVGSNRNSLLGYRFDEKPGKEIGGRFLADYTTVVIEDRTEVEDFFRDMASSKSLYVRIRSLNAGRTSAEFEVEGAAEAIAAATAGCKQPAAPVKPLPARKKLS
jgi:hypothetical protein